MTDRELMQQALDALSMAVEPKKGKVYAFEFQPIDCPAMHFKAIEALRARLAQEPLTFEASNVTGIYTTQPYAAQAAMVAQQTQGRMSIDPVTGDVGIGTVKPEPEAEVCCQEFDKCLRSCTPRGQWIAHNAAQREWVNLTDDEIRIAWGPYFSRGVDVARVIEALLKKRNT